MQQFIAAETPKLKRMATSRQFSKKSIKVKRESIHMSEFDQKSEHQPAEIIEEEDEDEGGYDINALEDLQLLQKIMKGKMNETIGNFFEHIENLN